MNPAGVKNANIQEILQRNCLPEMLASLGADATCMLFHRLCARAKTFQ